MTRTVLLLANIRLIDLSMPLILKIYGVGLLFDLVTMMCAAVPLVFYLIIVPSRLFGSAFHRIVFFVLSYVTIFLLVFVSLAEYLFFDEFGARFNFIAVDYLIYTTEVMRNIWESYPVPALMSAVAVLSALLFFPLRRVLDTSRLSPMRFADRLGKGLVFLVLPIILLGIVYSVNVGLPGNNYAHELSLNGIYSFVAAFVDNTIDYRKFYATTDDISAFRSVRMYLDERNSVFTGDGPFDMTREIVNQGKEKRLNVVVIIAESLSAEFLGSFGNKENLTPHLDSLAGESLVFTNFYATGTRTDRGIEAITLSLPPTPGRSVVKRPRNEGLFSWGFIMKSRGYDTKFLYGGNGFFDNMNYFFSHNGFDTLDKRRFSADEIHFENAWGVCDEDLFDKAISEFNESHQRGKPFFAEIVTTSNHRPYTYPEGRIDIPPHTGRRGAVKYTDYAIGRFITKARAEKWFSSTVFVVVADHCANSAGKAKLPVDRYHIPLIVFSPDHVRPGRVDTLASQIDLAPTMLGLLNFSYRSKFFGRDVLKLQPDEGMALIGTYQKLGYLSKDRLIVLDVKREAGQYTVDLASGDSAKTETDPVLLQDAIGIYQVSDYLFRNGGGTWDSP